jgi:anti-anti-sigma factor
MLNVQRRSSAEIGFSGEADLANAEAFRRALLEVIDAPGEIRLCFADLNEMDTAGLQILLAFARARGREGVRILECPETLRRRIRLAGLATWIPV